MDTQFNMMDYRTGLLLLTICWAGEDFSLILIRDIFICASNEMHDMRILLS